MSKLAIVEGKSTGNFKSLVGDGQIINMTIADFGKRCLDDDNDVQYIKSNSSNSTYLPIDVVVMVGDKAVTREFKIYEDSIGKTLTDLCRQLKLYTEDDAKVRELEKLSDDDEIKEAHRAAAFVTDAHMAPDDFIRKYLFNKTVKVGKPPKSFTDAHGWQFYYETVNPDLLSITKADILARQEAKLHEDDEKPVRAKEVK